MSRPPPLTLSGQEEEDGDAGAPASSDDGSVIDQSGAGLGPDAATVGVVGGMASEAAKGQPGWAAARADAAAHQGQQQQQQPWQDQGAAGGVKRAPPSQQQQQQQQHRSAGGQPAAGRAPAPGELQPPLPRASPAPVKPLPPAPIAAAAPPPSKPSNSGTGLGATGVPDRPDSALTGSEASSLAAGGFDAGGLAASAGGPVTVASLIWHPSDLAVKPIVANRRIERLPEPRFDARALPFQPLGLAELLDTDQKVGLPGGDGG
jgi:hypothetical protein